MSDSNGGTKGKSRDQAVEQMAAHYWDRAEAAKIYLTGELDAKRNLLLASGDVPWRVLRYERIIDPETLSYPLGKNRYVRPNTFELHLKYLTRKCVVLTLDELFTRVEANAEIPPNAVAITIDGGWFDNFVYAAPLIKKFGVPVTMFVAPYFIGTQNYPWQDKVVIALLAMKKLGGKFLPFDFFETTDRRLLEEVSPEGEISLDLISRTVAVLSRHTPENRLIALSAFGKIMSVANMDLPAEPAFMNWNDIRMLEGLPVSFGALTNGGSLCHELSYDMVFEEIRDAFVTLENRTTQLARIFSFPEGLVTGDAMRALTQLKITRALGIEGIGHPQNQTTPPLVLGRVPIVEGNSYATELLACLLWHEMGVVRLA